jgi:hypothetical protein
MPVSRALRQLLLVREMEEEQRRLAIESAVTELQLRQAALARNVERAREGRRLVLAGIRSNQFSDQIAGCEEQRTAERHTAYLHRLVDEANERVEVLRAAYLSARKERYQAQTLIEKIETEDSKIAIRTEQRDLDDWYRLRTEITSE